jgi:hypothetical protein
MDADKFVPQQTKKRYTVYAIIDDLLKAIGDDEDCRRNMSNADWVISQIMIQLLQPLSALLLILIH